MKNSILVLAIAICMPSFAIDKKDVTQRYKGKYLVVVREGLAFGVCSAPSSRNFLSGGSRRGDMIAGLAVRIDGDKAEYHDQTGMSAMMSNCESIVAEPLHKGEVLLVESAVIRGHELGLAASNVSPHQIDRGVGAFAHQSKERGGAILRFNIEKLNTSEEIDAIVSKWVKAFDSSEAAAQFGNTASGVFVKQVKLGMSPGEVESVLGPPATRADLDAKMLYKYSDITVEFKDGKVVDVR